jgi:V/A-type H+-transporting ATPase subunit D
MAGQISPTRTALLASKAQLKLATNGAELLKRKRDALIGEFFALVRDALAAREELAGVSRGAYTSLFSAKSWDTPEAVESLSLAQPGGLMVNMQIESVYGVKVPRIELPEAKAATNFSPINVGTRTIQAATDFQGVMQALIKVAATETKLRRIGEEIKKTSRRVNALEQIVIPTINGQIKGIADVLDQRALEEVTTLKRIKAKIDMREAEESGGPISPRLEAGAGL